VNWLDVYRFGYDRLAAPLIFLGSPQAAHEQVMRGLALLDDQTWMQRFIERVRQRTLTDEPVAVGGVTLPHPLILAAGFVKGRGFASEDEALEAVMRGENIIPGWRIIPALVGAVEFGSFTRWPRVGNTGCVLWRDVSTKSLQNRIGLKNPGVMAAAQFLSTRPLPDVFGINIAVSPGVNDEQQEQREIREALAAFLSRDVRPAWFTLNVSCPNTEDDPDSHQTDVITRALCYAAIDELRGTNIPLWVKIGPSLAEQQYRTLARVFEETSVRAVISTNTAPEPTPDDKNVTAGISGGRLHKRALDAAAVLLAEKQRGGYTWDVIACGGVMDGKTYQAFAKQGVSAAQYWSALIYRGPLAAAIIEREYREEAAVERTESSSAGAAANGRSGAHSAHADHL
jgi:dihydroorotate dehydrogenase